MTKHANSPQNRSADSQHGDRDDPQTPNINENGKRGQNRNVHKKRGSGGEPAAVADAQVGDAHGTATSQVDLGGMDKDKTGNPGTKRKPRTKRIRLPAAPAPTPPQTRHRMPTLSSEDSSRPLGPSMTPPTSINFILRPSPIPAVPAWGKNTPKSVREPASTPEVLHPRARREGL